MEIIYCDQCGHRIPVDETEQARAPGNKIYCTKCRPAQLAAAPARRPSGINLEPPPRRPSGINIEPPPRRPSAINIEPQRRRVTDTKTSVRRENEPAASPPMLLIAGVVIGVLLASGAVFFMSGPTRPNERAAASEAKALEPTPAAKPLASKDPAEAKSAAAPAPAHEKIDSKQPVVAPLGTSGTPAATPVTMPAEAPPATAPERSSADVPASAPVKAPAVASEPARPAPAPEKTQAELEDEAYAAFQTSFVNQLRAGAEAAARVLKAADAEPKLSRFKTQIAAHQRAVDWLKEIDGAFRKGVDKLKDADAITLKFSKGAPIEVGKNGPFKVVEIKGDKISLASGQLTMSMDLETLKPESRADIVNLGLGGDAAGRSRRALVEMLAPRAPDAPPLKTLIPRRDRIKAKSEEADIEYLESLALVIDSVAHEAAARAAFEPLSQALAAGNAKVLKAEIDGFITAHGATVFARGEKDAIARMKAMAAQTIIPVEGLVAHYAFEDSSNEKEAIDSVSKNKGSMGANVKYSTDVPPWGKDNKGSIESAGRSMVRTPRVLDTTDNYTLAAWIKPAVLTRSLAVVVCVGQDKAGFGFALEENSLVGLDGSQTWKSGYTFTETEKWHHVALVRKDGTSVFYVDGVEMSEKRTAGATPATGEYIAIGGEPRRVRAFEGKMDEVRIYSRPLAAVEIRNLAK